MAALPPWVSLLGVAALGGVIGGATTRLIPPRSGPAPLSSTGALAPEAASASDRLERLERRVGALERRRAAGQALTAYGEALARGESEGPAPARPDGGAAATAADSPAFELAVRSVLERVQEERELERESDRSLRQERRAAETITTLSTELALTPAQKPRFDQIMNEYFTALQKLRDRRAPDRPANRQERRDQVRALDAQTESKLSTILDGKQLNSFRERKQELLGFGGRRRRAE